MSPKKASYKKIMSLTIVRSDAVANAPAPHIGAIGDRPRFSAVIHKNRGLTSI